MKKTLLIAGAAAAALFTATAANASRVNWSIGINVPPVATVVSSPGYGYYAQPAYPAASYYAPTYYAPTYYAPTYYPASSYYYDEPGPVYYAPRVIHAPRHRGWVQPAPRHWRGGHDRWHHGGGRVDGRR